MLTAGITGIEGSNYSAIFTDEKSRKKLAINLKLKSDFAGIMTEFLARLATLPEMMVLDSGGENISKQFLEVCYRYCIRPRYTVEGEHEGNLAERSIQSLRDTAMTMLASAALSPVFWPFALMYAAVIDQFVPGPEGIAPYMHWHDPRTLTCRFLDRNSSTGRKLLGNSDSWIYQVTLRGFLAMIRQPTGYGSSIPRNRAIQFEGQVR